MLHLLTDDEVVRRSGWLDLLVTAAERGGPGLRIHLRAPRAPGAVVFRWADEVARRIEGTGAALSVNDRADVAAAVGAGVHLGQRSLDVKAARSVVGRGPVGVSCHDMEEVDAAVRAGADYLFAGAVFPTRSHPGGRTLGRTGLAALVARSAGTPVVGVGGVDPSHAAEIVATGAIGVAVIRGFWDAPDSLRALASYISGLESAREGT